MAERVPIAAFVDYIVWAYRNKCGYIMGSYGQNPRDWSASSWWFTQYSGAQRAKALAWRESAPLVFDCNGLAEGCYLKHTGTDINARARNNFANWCSKRGTGMIPASMRVPGAAVFVHNGSYISHVGYLWKPVNAEKPAGDWWVIEARGVLYGVVKTRLLGRGWNRYGWMTKYFDYDGSAEPPAARPLGARCLSVGCDGADVAELQTLLIARGYDCGRWGADGEYGADTRAAVRAFQTDQRLSVSGVYDDVTHAALTALIAGETPEAEPDPPAVYPVRHVCPDISEYQGDIDLDALCGGADFAIFRARVNGKDDARFEGWARKCKQRGFPFSVYDFITLTDEADAVAQAEAFYALTSPYAPIIYYLDVETLATGVGHGANRRFIRAYVEKLRALGAKRIGLYMGDYRYRTQYKRLEDIFDTLWIANWGKNDGYLSSLPETACDLHQYTSHGHSKSAGVPGIERRVDLNRLTGRRPLSYFTGRAHESGGYFGCVRTARATMVRAEADENAAVIGDVKPSTLLDRRAETCSDWLSVAFMDQIGYVRQSDCIIEAAP